LVPAVSRFGCRPSEQALPVVPPSLPRRRQAVSPERAQPRLWHGRHPAARCVRLPGPSTWSPATRVLPTWQIRPMINHVPHEPQKAEKAS